jgi:hypothetical protein
MSCVYPDENNNCSSSSSFCEEKMKKCKKLYNNYKKICEIAKPLDKCNDIDISKFTLTELEEYIKIYLKLYNNYLRCYNERIKHQSKCIHLSCIDDGHRIFLQKLQDSMTSCKNILENINNKIQDEMKELERKKQDIKKRQKELDKEKIDVINKEFKANKIKKTVKEIKIEQKESISVLINKLQEEELDKIKEKLSIKQLKYITMLYEIIMKTYDNFNKKIKLEKFVSDIFLYIADANYGKIWVKKFRMAIDYDGDKYKSYWKCGEELLSCLIKTLYKLSDNEILDVIVVFKKDLDHILESISLRT